MAKWECAAGFFEQLFKFQKKMLVNHGISHSDNFVMMCSVAIFIFCDQRYVAVKL